MIRRSKNTIIATVLLAGSIYFLGCSASKNTASVNPNGDSELALLMREMYFDGMEIKEAIQKGKLPKSHIDAERLLTAEATEPEKAASAEYKAYAQVYLAAYDHLLQSEGDAVQPAYRSLVKTCQSCHQALCPGPLARIKHMELSASD